MERDGQPDAFYDYDAMGRLVRKRTMQGVTPVNTFYYWVGLNRLAEETVLGNEAYTFVPDDESGEDPEDNGWLKLMSGDDMYYVTDTGRGEVLHLDRLTTTSWFQGVFFNTAPEFTPYEEPVQAVSLWLRAEHSFMIAFSGMLSDETGASVYAIFQEGEDTYYPPEGEEGVGHYYFYLGEEDLDANWHHFQFNLRDMIQSMTPGLTFAEIYYVAVGLNRESSPTQWLELDDIVFSTIPSAVEKTYQINPAAVIGSYLGAEVVSDDYPQYAGKWYYHYNDLGTVLAHTDEYGAQINAYEPSFYGDYAYTSGAAPDGIGLQSKGYDWHAGLYYFQARWYDQERRSFVSRDPISLHEYTSRFKDKLTLLFYGLSAYLAFNAMPSMFVDPDGKITGIEVVIIVAVGGLIIYLIFPPKIGESCPITPRRPPGGPCPPGYRAVRRSDNMPARQVLEELDNNTPDYECVLDE